MSQPPLCVDLDGTLIRTDLLWEAIFAALKDRPLALLRAVLQLLLHGKAAFKLQLARDVTPELDRLPLNLTLIERLRAERATGRRLVLATASPRAWAEGLAKRLELFDEVIATDGEVNLSGSGKADALNARFGEKGFDYAGNAIADLKVWRAARQAWVVAAPPLVARLARSQSNVVEEIPVGRSRKRSIVYALRPHQWAKNVLLFGPVMAAHAWFDLPSLIAAALAFVSLSLAASATYLLNDLLDLPNDRRHPRKRLRPFASGAAPLAWGALAMPLLLLLSACVALLLPPLFGAALALYVAITLSYSFWLKRKPIVDALTLAGLYTLRLFAGGAATGIDPSFWMLAFSMFLFLSLAFAKRYAELLVMLQAAKKRAAGRGYEVGDLPLVQSLGVGSGLMAVLVLTFYFDSLDARALYNHPQALWALCPLLMWWIGRVWLLTHRGRMHDDPVVFALRDRVSHGMGVMGAVALWLAL